jgi:hypothetical protein
MKRLWLIPLFCLFLLAGSIIPAVHVHYYCRDTDQQLSAVLQASDAGEWDTARRIADALQRDHAAYQRCAGWYASDNVLYAVQDVLGALSVHAAHADKPGLALTCAHAHTVLQTLAQEQAFSWEAIL